MNLGGFCSVYLIMFFRFKAVCKHVKFVSFIKTKGRSKWLNAMSYLLFSLTVILLHAALRMRNLKSKISNKIEFVGLKRTPMGLLLESLGMEAEAGS